MIFICWFCGLSFLTQLRDSEKAVLPGTLVVTARWCFWKKCSPESLWVLGILCMLFVVLPPHPSSSFSSCFLTGLALSGPHCQWLCWWSEQCPVRSVQCHSHELQNICSGFFFCFFFLQDWQFFFAICNLSPVAYASDQQGKPPLPSKALKEWLGEMLGGRDTESDGDALCKYILLLVDVFTFRWLALPYNLFAGGFGYWILS